MKPNRKRSTGRRRLGRGALIVLALFLAVSGALRLGDGIGTTMARADAAGAEAGTSAPALDCPKPPLAVVEALALRESRVAAQEIAIADRLAALALADEAIKLQLTKLEEAETSLSKTLTKADGASEADLSRLTEVYQSMKPKDAASLFAAMAPEFAAGFLARMRPEAAGAVMSGMPPEAAYTISVLLAGRHANVPKQ